MKKYVLFFAVAVLLCTQPSYSQDLAYVGLNGTPLNLNPAFTGLFGGSVRANVLDNSNWSSVIPDPYHSVTASVDLPVFTDRRGNFLAAGVQLNKGWLTSEGIANFGVAPSLAYHNIFKRESDSNSYRFSDLSFGLQMGYSTTTMDRDRLSFSMLYGSTVFRPLSYGIPRSGTFTYMPVNAGISFTHAAGKHFNYTIGVSAYNINQSGDEIEGAYHRWFEQTRTYLGQAGLEWTVSDHFVIRPSIVYQNADGSKLFAAGTECQLVLNRSTVYHRTALFLGGWYSNSYLFTATAGLEFLGLKVGARYGFFTSSFSSAESVSGFAVSARYIAPGHRHSRQSVRFQ